MWGHTQEPAIAFAITPSRHCEYPEGAWQSDTKRRCERLAPLSLYPVLHTASLPMGSYIFYFVVDLLPNGVLDFEQLIVDSVGVTIHWP